MFTSLLNAQAGSITIQNTLICLAASFVCGFIIAGVYMYKSIYTKSFVTSLVILPALVQVVITVVNGNLGASVAVMGAFSLVRFRSVPGSSKDITAVFFAMAVGLANGMGYVTYSATIVVAVGLLFLLLNLTKFGEKPQDYKELKILIPESLDYTNVFDDLFEKYLEQQELVKVKTTDLGSIYELSYHIKLKDAAKEKEFLDEIRCRNGNLTIICGRPHNTITEVL
ncbi:MAG: DUF4956 domain-containing protein [Lachnospiraceae bacterium]